MLPDQPEQLRQWQTVFTILDEVLFIIRPGWRFFLQLNRTLLPAGPAARCFLRRPARNESTGQTAVMSCSLKTFPER